MKITSSSIAMASNHHENSFVYTESASMEASANADVAGAILTLSKEAGGMDYTESMQKYEKMQKDAAEENKKKSAANLMQRMAKDMKANRKKNQYDIPDELDAKIKMLRRMLAALNGEKIPDDLKKLPRDRNGILDLRSAEFRMSESTSFAAGEVIEVSGQRPSVGTTGNFSMWQRISVTSGFMSESECTTFASKGIAKTADGRSIDFNIEVSMSREFTAQINTLEIEEYVKTDPLMINLDTNVGTVSDQKFLFDLNSDGKKENISFAGKGSGFLAIDRNGDGKINDGSELFGTRSGDGFYDLSMYDHDRNGWIDESDSIFSKLKVWTKDENGNDYLIDLKQADVGAIYLGNADTQFSVKNDVNKLNAEIKKTGIYLRESSGAVGTLNHVDLVL